MTRIRWTFLLVAVAASLAALPASAALFRGGPQVLDAIPADAGEPLHFVERTAVLTGAWPAPVTASVAQRLAVGQDVLVVGRTDAIGPQSLNRSLGLQFAAHAARALAAAVGAGLERFACASLGETESQAAGVSLYVWSPPPSPAVLRDRRAVILEPLAGLPNRGLLWGVWQGTPRTVLLGYEDGEQQQLWEIPAVASAVRLPLPARGQVVGLGAAFSAAQEELETVTTQLHPPLEMAALELALAAVEDGWVRVTARLPSGLERPTVWAGGVPYPVLPDLRGEAEVALARLGRTDVAYLQAFTADGQIAVGAPLVLPETSRPSADWVAVLVWEGDGVDLDLHVWSGARHTHALNTDAAYSEEAVPGVQLLFDGDDRQPVSAVAAWGQRAAQIEAHCYSDLSGDGAVARMYLLQRGQDPLARRLRVYGPRTLSEQPTQARWAPIGEGDFARQLPKSGSEP